MINAQEWLDENYPKEQRGELTNLDIRKNNLKGSIIFERFDNLEYLTCGDNEITNVKLNNLPKLTTFCCCNAELSKLTVNNCPNISHFDCKLNLIKEFDFDSLNFEKLKYLELYNNNFQEQNLTCFSKFINLEKLFLGKIMHDYGGNWASRHLYTSECNQFSGSLKPLQNLTKLKILDITNTNLDFGLEYLPESLEEIHCDISQSSETRCGILRQQLEPYEKRNDYNVSWYDYQTWRKANQSLIDRQIEKEKIEQQLKELAEVIFFGQTYNFTQLKQEITRLKYQELAPQVRNKKTKFEGLVSEAKNKAGEGSFAPIVDLLLTAHQEIIQTTESSQKDKLTGKIEAYQSILENKLTQEELQNLLAKQTELCQLEKHLTNLQINEQQAQIQQIYPPR